jgi:hypothetical protein
MATKTNKSTDIANKYSSVKAIRFLEELSWLFQTHHDLDAKSISKLLSDAASQNTVEEGVASFASPNPNIHFLVGILPLVLRDESIFSTNGVIADFAISALGMNMSRWEKKSRFELIGEIVCNTIDLDDSALTKLVEALSVLAKGDSTAREIVKEAQSSSRGWNEIIQTLIVERR